MGYNKKVGTYVARTSHEVDSFVCPRSQFYSISKLKSSDDVEELFSVKPEAVSAGHASDLSRSRSGSMSIKVLDGSLWTGWLANVQLTAGINWDEL